MDVRKCAYCGKMFSDSIVIHDKKGYTICRACYHDHLQMNSKEDEQPSAHCDVETSNRAREETMAFNKEVPCIEEADKENNAHPDAVNVNQKNNESVVESFLKIGTYLIWLFGFLISITAAADANYNEESITIFFACFVYWFAAGCAALLIAEHFKHLRMIADELKMLNRKIK